MAVIEPIPESSSSAASSSSTATSARTSLPKPPPRSGDFTYAQPTDKPRDVDETLKSWDSIPLFMKDLPDDPNSDTTAALEALQSLAFDGTPDEVALNFKTQANDYFKSRRYREALGFYTQAIDAHPEDKSLLETLYANRAACNLELQNYGATLRDTSQVLGLNASNEKAYYRATKALIALDRCKDALECADHGLKINPSNDAIRALRTNAETRLRKLKEMEEEKTERKRREVEMASAVQHALIVRGLWLETTSRPPDNPKPAHFDPDSLPPQSNPTTLPLRSTSSSSPKWTAPDVIRTPLILPVFFMYPQYAQSDFISDYHEDTPISDYIETIFPPHSRGTLPWDTKHEYYHGNLHVYATTRKQRLLKVGKKLSLRQLIDQAFQQGDPKKGEDPAKDRDGLVMKDGILSLVVLPKGEAEKEWVDRFKAEREKSTKN